MPHPMPTFLKYQEPSIDTLKSLANNNHKGSLSTQYGTMPSNYYPAHQHHSQEDSYVSHKMKSKRYQKLWQNIYKEELSDQELDHTLQMSSSSKRKMANYVQYKTTVPSINGQRKIAMYPH